MEFRHEEDTARRGGFDRLHLSWPMLLLAAWLLYEFTAQPGFAALIACAKFGWADTRTAFWLRRADPDCRRGQTCFWCYLAFALWKVAMMATISMIALTLFMVTLLCMRGRPLGNETAMLMGALVAAAVGVGLSCLASHIALWSAWRNGIRIWMGYAPRRAWQERFWPPYHGRINAAPFVIFTALGVALCASIGLMIVLLVICQPGEIWSVLLISFSIFIPAIIILALNDAAKRRFARSPQECWTAEEDEVVYQEHSTEERMRE